MLQTVDEFCRLLLFVKDNPGFKQADLVHLTGMDKVKVCRLVKTGVKNGVLQKNKRALFIGTALLPRII
jgi:DNA-binding IclR family transcriptional regulator